jgi:flagellar biosynthesis GTPase FlhF
MSVQIFVAANAREGLARIRAELGDDAVVLSTRPHPQGVEMLASAYGELAVQAVGETPEPAPVRASWLNWDACAACCKTSWPALPGAPRGGAIRCGWR